MRVSILAVGSRGDVQPYVALGLGLHSAGHDVRLIAPGVFEELIRSRGLDHASSGLDPREISDTDAGRDWVANRTSARGFLRGLVTVASSVMNDGMSACWRACPDAEALIVSPMGYLFGYHIAEKLGVPLICAFLAPSTRTHYDLSGRRGLATAIRGECKAVVEGAFRFLLWRGLRSSINAARRDVLGLKPLSLLGAPVAMSRARIPLLDGYSRAVVPRPPDWGKWIHVTGYWFLDRPREWEPPSDLVDFLESGPPPVFVGFGSTPFPDAEATTELVVRALERARRRGVVVTGGSGLGTGRLSDDVLEIDSVPHDWLLPRMSVAVHQGGAGVTGAALRAGLPSVVVPVFADQPFWGQRIFDLGAGPSPIPARQLSVESLANAISAASTAKGMRRRAVELGERIRAEDGVARAVEAFHHHLGLDHSRTAYTM